MPPTTPPAIAPTGAEEPLLEALALLMPALAMIVALTA